MQGMCDMGSCLLGTASKEKEDSANIKVMLTMRHCQITVTKPLINGMRKFINNYTHRKIGLTQQEK